MKKILLSIITALTTSAAMASADTLSNLQYNISFPLHPTISSCNTLLLDATGDLRYSSKWSVYGVLNCKNGTGFGVNGVAYLGTNNHIYLWVSAGYSGRALCDLSTRACSLVDTSLGSWPGKAYQGTIK